MVCQDTHARSPLSLFHLQCLLFLFSRYSNVIQQYFKMLKSEKHKHIQIQQFNLVKWRKNRKLGFDTLKDTNCSCHCWRSSLHAVSNRRHLKNMLPLHVIFKYYLLLWNSPKFSISPFLKQHQGHASTKLWHVLLTESCSSCL